MTDTAPKRRPGRPRTTGRGHAGPRVTVRLSPDELSALRYVAAAWQVSAPEYLRSLIIEHLDLPRCENCGIPAARRIGGWCEICDGQRPPEDDVAF